MKKIFALLAFAATVGTVPAQIVLADGNSRAEIDPTSSGFPFLRGMNHWEVDGVNQLFQQWYWFRIGGTPERSIDQLSAPEVSQLTDNSVNIAYANDAIGIDVTFTLLGGAAGSGTADISEVVRVHNFTNISLDFHLFEYDDFDVSGTFDDDRAVRLDSSSIRQFDSRTSLTVGTVSAADHWQIATVPDIFDALTDASASTLTDAASGSGPGDFAFAFQWDRQIAAGGTFLMSKNKLVEIVPEPTSAVVMVVGLGVWIRRRQVRRSGRS